MSRGFPSMTALLGLLAIAGYQNRDRIAEMLGGLGQGKSGAPNETGLGGLLGELGGSLGGTSAGGVLRRRANSLSSSNKTDKARPRNPGSKPVPTNR